LGQAVDELDSIIRDIRRAIFELRAPAMSSLRADVLASVDRAGAVLGFRPALTISGPIDLAVPDVLRDDLLAVLRETLSNVARHAGASAVDIRLTVTGEAVSLEVGDNGVGGAVEAWQRSAASTATGGNGLRNLAARAAERGGAFVVEPGPAAGTVVRWSVPLAL
jgi:signal transduction histidine kinase